MGYLGYTLKVCVFDKKIKLMLFTTNFLRFCMKISARNMYQICPFVKPQAKQGPYSLLYSKRKFLERAPVRGGSKISGKGVCMYKGMDGLLC